MKKSVGILSGLAIAIAVAITAGAWYTGTRLPAELDHSVSVGNAELKKALLGTGGSMTIELAGVEQHFFTSTAQYRLKAKDINLGQGEALNFEVGFTDRIEHGPFPWSRVKALKLMPVMATSNSTLQKDDFTAPWFAATGEQPPVTAQVSLGYGGNVDSKIQLAPFKFSEDNGSSIDFSGLQLEAAGDQDGKASKFHGAAERLDIKVVGDDHPPATLALQGLKIGGNLAATEHDMIYVAMSTCCWPRPRRRWGPSSRCCCSRVSSRMPCRPSMARTPWVGVWITRSRTSPGIIARSGVASWR